MTEYEINYFVHRTLGRTSLPVPNYCHGDGIEDVPGDHPDPKMRCLCFLVAEGVIKAASVA
jgi:hypothetical protein